MSMRRLGRGVVLGLALFLGAVGPVAAEAAPEAAVDLAWGVKIPLRDGIRLNATVYRPQGQAEPLPVVFTLTPYIADSYHQRAMFFARHGYVFALVDVRGRGSSEGVFDPFAQEDRDGYDVVEWLAKQPWANGKVAMWGGSYAGFDQWAAAKELPPHLATIVPAASAHPGVDFPFSDNIFYPYGIQWLTFTSGATPNGNLFGENGFWFDKFRQLFREQRPFADLPELVGNPSAAAVFERWLAHPRPDAYWDAMVPTAEQYAKIDLPILSITGHYDGDQAGALAFYRGHLRHASETAKAKHYLIVGPWDHAGTRTPNREVGGLTFGEASLVDLNQLHLEWYDWTMKSGPKPAFLKDRVAWYVAAADQWRYAASLEAIPMATRTWFLASDGSADDAFHSGKLVAGSAPPSKPGAAADRYVYDPKSGRAAEWQAADDPRYLLNQTAVLTLAGDGLVYHTEPFDRDTEITGSPRFLAWLSIDVPDLDFQVDLSEILPDGTSVALSTDQMRARHRESPRQEKRVEPGKALPYDFDSFTFFSRRIAKGSRLRLVISSPNSIYSEKNWAGGGVVARESGKDARTAHVTLYHDAGRPSRLELPVEAQ